MRSPRPLGPLSFPDLPAMVSHPFAMTERREWNTASVPARPEIDGGDPTAGLVLVYSREFAQLPPAIPFTQDTLSLGREPDNSLPLPDGSVSRYHAKVERRDGRVAVQDLGSTNGTIVNGRYVTDAPLAHGDIIRVGDTILKFVARELNGYMAYRIDGRVDEALRPVPRLGGPGEIIGGFQVDRIIADLEKISAGALTILIRGESGTGTELVARQLHRTSGRIVKAADKGTLFLDEIGEMPLEAQVKLLRVLQEREVQPIGGTQTERIDVRFVAATNRDLPREVARGRFRGDLFARLNEFSVELPPLRDRKEDLYLLARHFLAKHGRADVKPSFTLMLALSHYDWPYRVRELESALRRAAALTKGELEVCHLPDVVQHALRSYASRDAARTGYGAESEQTRVAVSALGSGPIPVPAIPAPRRAAPTQAELVEALRRTGGNISAIAREYGKDRVQVHRWLKKFGIDPSTFRSETAPVEGSDD